MKLWPVVSFLLLVALVVCWITRPSSNPVQDVGRDAHADSAAGIQRMDSNAIASADSALAKEKRDSTVQQLVDSAARLGKRLDERDRLAALALRQKRAAIASRDSALAVVDSMIGSRPDTLALDSATVDLTPPDNSLSCENRYLGRLQQIGLLADAVENCQQRRMALQAVIVGLRDTLGVTKHFSHITDSLLAWEVVRPRPCQVDLFVKKVGCGTAMGGTAVISFILGFVARR